MHEIVVNLHMHTGYSDGSGSHAELAAAALRCGLDAIIVTDHNVFVDGAQRYLKVGDRRLLVLIGEELHDRQRLPQKNHLLVLDHQHELSQFAQELPGLLEAVQTQQSLAFLAHPVDPAAPAFREPNISWDDWSISGFTGIELWNGFSELKFRIPSRLHGLVLAFFPAMVAHGPPVGTLRLWDALLVDGKCVAIGGSDAHALKMRAGPLRRTVFPYDYHFRAVNTHILLDAALTGSTSEDARAVFAAIAAGRCFVGYDLPASTRGFRFWAHTQDGDAPMGSAVRAGNDVSLHATAPEVCELRLLKDGRPVRIALHAQTMVHTVVEKGVYRLEAYRRYLGRRRGWIYSNPVYVRA